MDQASVTGSSEWTYSFNRLPSALFNSFVPVMGALAAAFGLIVWSSWKSVTVHVLATILGVLLVAAVVARCRRVGIWASPTRVVARTFFRTQEFSWADVEELRATQFGQYRGWQFKMKDGRWVSVACLPIRRVFGETQQLAAASATPVKVVTGGNKPDDF